MLLFEGLSSTIRKPEDIETLLGLSFVASVPRLPTPWKAKGSPEQQAMYVPKMVSGEWGGTMNLTEPQCGTDLGLIRTKAEPQADGSYKITGTKIFISAGEHDLTDNIIHARVEAASAASAAGSSASATISGVSAGAPIASRTASSLARLRPAIAHRSSFRSTQYSATSRPVKPVAP
ncbi:hypothetical protein [Bacillus amyloliquefaciens]|uniref:hypothetical protein n=1 Tax=Bacillus amyloliquefaciens TaxID=1390 RepID=UPI003D80BB9B